MAHRRHTDPRRIDLRRLRPRKPAPGRDVERRLRVSELAARQHAIVEYLGWFNHTRLHESLGDIPPAEIEALYAPRSETTISLEIKRGTQLTR